MKKLFLFLTSFLLVVNLMLGPQLFAASFPYSETPLPHRVFALGAFGRNLEYAVGTFFLETDLLNSFDFGFSLPRFSVSSISFLSRAPRHSYKPNTVGLTSSLPQAVFTIPESLRLIAPRAISESASLWDALKNALRFVVPNGFSPAPGNSPKPKPAPVLTDDESAFLATELKTLRDDLAALRESMQTAPAVSAAVAQTETASAFTNIQNRMRILETRLALPPALVIAPPLPALENRLVNLEQKLLSYGSLGYEQRSANAIPAASSPTPFTAFALSQKIDKLSDVSFSGENNFNLKDSDIPDTITSANYLPLAGGTLSGAFAINGNETLNGILTLSSFAATSTTATSTLAYGFTAGTGGGNFGFGTSTPSQYFSVAGPSYLAGTLLAGTTTIPNLIVQNTGTSSFSGALQSSFLNITGSSASSTFANGITLANGCYAVGGTCIISNTANLSGSGTQNFITKWTAGTALGNSSIFDDGTFIGLGTSTPLTTVQKLRAIYGSTTIQVWENVPTAFQILNAATSSVFTVDTVSNRVTFDYGSTTALSATSGTITNASSTYLSSLQNLSVGNDLFVTGDASTTYFSTLQNANIGNSLFVVASSTFQNLINVGTGTSTFNGGIIADLLNIRNTSATSTFANGITLANGCFAINGVCVGANASGWQDDGSIVRLTAATDFVGIGTSTPLNPLSVYGSTTIQVWENVPTAFQILNAATTSVFTVDTTRANGAGQIVFAYASSTGQTITYASTTALSATAGTITNASTTYFSTIQNANIGNNLAVAGSASSTYFSTSQNLLAGNTLDVAASATIRTTLNVGGTILSDGTITSRSGTSSLTNLNLSGNFEVGGSATTTFNQPIAHGSGDLIIARGGTGNLLLNPYGGNVGIASTSPWGLLSVNANALAAGTPQFVVGSSTATNLIVANNGNVGIGTTGPGGILDITKDSGVIILQPTAVTANGETKNSPTLAITGAYDACSDGSVCSIPYSAQFLNTMTAVGASRLDVSFGLNYSGGSSVVSILSSGNVGIGTTGPVGPLQIAKPAASDGLPAASGTTQTGLIARLSTGTYSSVLDIGMQGNGTGKTWLQVADAGNLGQNYPLLLNPNGGNVGIGTTGPGYKLEVAAGGATALGVTGTSQVISTFRSTTNSGGTRLYIGNDLSAAQGELNTWGSTYVTNAYQVANGTELVANGAGGLTLAAANASGVIKFVAGGLTEKVRIDTSGNVGIGTTSPSGKLHVEGSAPTVWIKGTGATDNVWTATANATRTWLAGVRGDTSHQYQIIDSTAGTAVRLAIDTSGNVGIGTTNPNEGKVEVKGGSVCVDTNSDDIASSCIANESDARLKENIETLNASTSLDVILNLNPVSFDWRVNDFEVLKHYPLIARFASSTHSVGLIAQEVAPIIPEAISLETVGDSEVQYFQLDYYKFIPYIVGAVKELWTKAQDLSQKVAALFRSDEEQNAKIQALEARVKDLEAQIGAAAAPLNPPLQEAQQQDNVGGENTESQEAPSDEPATETGTPSENSESETVEEIVEPEAGITFEPQQETLPLEPTPAP